MKKDMHAGSRFSSWRLMRLGFTLVALGLAAWIFCQACFTDGETGLSLERIEIKDIFYSVWPLSNSPEAKAVRFLGKHQVLLDECVRMDKAAFDEAVEALEYYFELKRGQIPNFLDDLFSFGSKSKMAWYYIRDEEKLEKYIQEKSEYHLGGPRDLETEIKRVTQTLRLEIESNHNQLMAELGAALAADRDWLNLAPDADRILTDVFRASFDHAVKAALPRNIGIMVGTQVVGLLIDAYIVGPVVRAVVGALVRCGIVRLGAMATEAGVLGAGMAAAPETFGISIVVGLVIAVVIDHYSEKAAMADAEKEIVRALDRWENTTMSQFKKAVPGVWPSFIEPENWP